MADVRCTPLVPAQHRRDSVERNAEYSLPHLAVSFLTTVLQPLYNVGYHGPSFLRIPTTHACWENREV